jgi:hypothetical protein
LRDEAEHEEEDRDNACGFYCSLDVVVDSRLIIHNMNEEKKVVSNLEGNKKVVQFEGRFSSRTVERLCCSVLHKGEDD